MRHSLLGLSLVAIFASFLAAGCALESGGNKKDSGHDDGNTNTDHGPQYPPPPYGVNYLDTVEDFTVKECLCSNGISQGKDISLDAFLADKATLVTVHAGWCTYCKQQATTMENDTYQPYKDQGLGILLIIFDGDTRFNCGEQHLLDVCCKYKSTYGMTFTLAIDPCSDPNTLSPVLGKYFRPTDAGTPLNMLLSKAMQIRYKVEGAFTSDNPLPKNIEGLLAE